jgi:hypothetical protein
MGQFTEAQQMLCLAALSYRAFADVGPPDAHAERLRQDIASKLQALAPLQDQWALAWGPSAYRAPLSVFDDAAMYVAQNTARPNEYVVAVRGTNPVSAFDWVFGDLWVAGQVPWPFGSTNAARISLSTALGLDILLQLRASSQPAGPAAAAWAHLEQRLGHLADRIKNVLVSPLEKDAIAPIRERLQKTLADFASHRARVPLQDREAQVRILQTEWSPAVRQQLVKEVAAVLDALGAQPSLHLLALLGKDAGVSARLAGGHDLVSFLKAAVRSVPGTVKIFVTGHSKGGALAPTLALWLAETQGPAAEEAHRWDPEKRASIECYSFAGPTAGNAAFAARSNQMIGDRCHRIHNRLDVVPKAWVPNDLRSIGSLYDPAIVAPIPGLGPLANDIAEVLETQHLAYAHIGNDVQELPGTIDASKREFVTQLVHQHLQGYLDQMRLGDLVSVDTFFNPLR